MIKGAGDEGRGVGSGGRVDVKYEVENKKLPAARFDCPPEEESHISSAHLRE